MLFVALLLPAVGLAALAVGLAALAWRRTSYLEATGQDPRRVGVKLPLAASAAMVGAGALLIALPFLYLLYEVVRAAPFD